MTMVYLNGRLVDEKRAVVSAFDRGFLYGDGLFETMRAYGGRVFRLGEHLARLKASAKALRIPFKTSRKEIESAVERLLCFNVAQPPSAAAVSSSHPRAGEPHQKDAYVRLTLTRGPHSGDLKLDTGARPTLVIQARKFHGYPKTLYKTGMKLALADAVRATGSGVGRHKTLNYLENLLARDAAKRGGFDEALFLDERGFVAECSASNIFWVRRCALFTPGIDMNILAGITRAAVSEIARAAGLKVREGRFRLAELKSADEVFLTNSLMEIMPVCDVAGNRFKPGAVTRELAAAYRTLVAAECG